MFINEAHFYFIMKFGIALENTKKSIDFFDRFFEKFKCEHNYELEVFVIAEFVEQKREVAELKKLISRKIYDLGGIQKYNVLIDHGDPTSMVLDLISKRKIDIFVVAYEHSFLGNNFFEKVIRDIEIPILTIK